MVRALFDTNILLDHLNSIPASSAELKRYAGSAISIVTWMEVLVGADAGTEAKLRAFLNEFTVVGLDADIAERAIVLRRTYRLKIADAIIWASAQVHGMLFVTRDAKDFPKGDPGIRIPYRL
jgi:predicted nucleic acid-binding protein